MIRFGVQVAAVTFWQVPQAVPDQSLWRGSTQCPAGGLMSSGRAGAGL